MMNLWLIIMIVIAGVWSFIMTIKMIVNMISPVKKKAIMKLIMIA